MNPALIVRGAVAVGRAIATSSAARSTMSRMAVKAVKDPKNIALVGTKVGAKVAGVVIGVQQYHAETDRQRKGTDHAPPVYRSASVDAVRAAGAWATVPIFLAHPSKTILIAGMVNAALQADATGRTVARVKGSADHAIAKWLAGHGAPAPAPHPSMTGTSFDRHYTQGPKAGVTETVRRGQKP